MLNFKVCRGLGPMLLMSVFLFAIVDCGSNNSSNTSSTTVDATLTSLYANVFSTNCAQCHTAATAATSGGGAALDFSTIATAYSTLFAKVSGTSAAVHCSSLNMVNATSPSTSYLVAVLISSYATTNFDGVTNCSVYNDGTHSTYLNSAEQTALVTWIQSGAQNN